MKSVTTPLVLGVFLSLALAACGGTAASPAPTAGPPTAPPPTEVPGGIDGSPGPDTGVVGGGGGGIIPGKPDLVVARPGTTNDPHPVSIETLEPQIDGRRVVIIATWTSGTEPCYVLDTVAVKQDGNAFTISMTEGSADPNAMCIEIAQQHATGVDLGELPPGEYTVEAQEGTAKPISFTVS